MLTRAALLKTLAGGLLMGRYSGPPVPVAAGTVPSGDPERSGKVQSFTVSPTFGASSVSRQHTPFTVRGCTVLNQSGNTVLVAFSQIGDTQLLSKYNMVVEPWHVAALPVDESEDFTFQAIYAGESNPATTRPGDLTQLITITVSEEPVSPVYTALGQNPAFRQSIQSMRDVATTYTVWEFVLGPSASVWMSSVVSPRCYHMATGVDIHVDKSSPGLVYALLSGNAANAGSSNYQQTFGVLNVNGFAPTSGFRHIEPGGDWSLPIQLGPSADVLLTTPATAGSYTGSVLVKGY